MDDILYCYLEDLALLGCLLARHLRRGGGQEDDVGFEVGLVDAGEGAGLQVQHADLPAVHHRADAEGRP